MNKVASTSLLLISALVLAGFIFFHERDLLSTTEKNIFKSKVIPFEIESLKKISWTYNNSKQIAEKDDSGKWRLISDNNEIINPKWINSLETSLKKAIPLERISSKELSENSNLKERYEFKTDNQLSIATNNGNKVTLQIGEAGPLTNTVFVKASSNNKKWPSEDVILIKNTIPKLIGAKNITDPKMFHLKESDLLHLSLKNQNYDIKLDRPTKDQLWTMKTPIVARVGDKSLEIPMMGISKTRIFEVEKEKPSILNNQEPLIEIKAKQTEKISETILIWKTGTNTSPVTYAKSDQRPYWYKVTNEILNLNRLRPEFLRDPQLARLNYPSLKGITVSSKNNKHIDLLKQNNIWQINTGLTTYEANPDRIKKFISALNKTEVYDYFIKETDQDKLQLQDSSLDLFFTTQEGVDESKAGDGTTSIKLSFAQGANNKVYSYYAHEPDVYEINPNFLSSIRLNPIRWKSLSLLKFSPLSLRSITISTIISPPIELTFDPFSGGWKCLRSGEDLTEHLDYEKTETIASMLSSFQVTDWVSSSASVSEKFENPSLIVKTVIEQADENNESYLYPIAIELASSAPKGNSSPLYYGRIKGYPDIFLLNKDKYDLLATPPFDKKSLKKRN